MALTMSNKDQKKSACLTLVNDIKQIWDINFDNESFFNNLNLNT